VDPVIGIDLGTTNSVVATVRQSCVEVIPDAQGHRLHPSVVSFLPGGEVLVGHAARVRRHVDPENTVFSAKRLIGQSIKNPVVQLALSSLPYRVEEGPNEQALVSCQGKPYTVPEISAFVVRHLKQCAERYLGAEVKAAVVTVPANFTDAQRQATKYAGELAGLEVLRILNEPTAAALAYGFGRSVDARLCIYDLGGGTFDVTVLEIRDKIFEVLATGGDAFLGGDDFDRTIVDHLISLFGDRYKIDVHESPEAWAKLLIAAEEIKCQLSKDDSVVGQVRDLAVTGGERVSLDFELSRDKLERMIGPYLERTLVCMGEVLLESSVAKEGLSDLILVGGSTRTPLVRRLTTDYLSRAPQTRINPDETVAYGAAIQAAALIKGAEHTPGDFYSLLLDVAPRALGIAVAGGFAECIVDKNTPIPVVRQRKFVTSHDHQTKVEIQVCQGESRLVAENERLGTLTLDDIPPRPRGESEIEVTFTIDTDGILNVRARDLKTDQATQARMQVLAAPLTGADASQVGDESTLPKPRS
jgi:molecular chaperone DnaK